ncbi:hypothetical protein [Gulosibacter chungangensis]|uniref:Uncharacterized protein n=1 Tax=Gulosibacter chungangensis TaxID=979746 RepID=A0A7J5BBC7_9MICO|nr:hypothetical protein [Gulosibacter chungangensis]KAB1643040.1 hypothetical protein F8O05_07240 [Gulosibacter chungangensis]
MSRRETRAQQESRSPVTLPLVVVTVERGGTLAVTVDGAPFAPEAFAPAWRRSDFGRIMDRITDQRRTPVRVEVHESDGTSFTDIITPSPSRRTRPEPEPAKTETAFDAPAAPQLVEVTAEGFIPGEDIGVAIIVTHTDASHTGRARALLEAAQFDASPTGEVVLIGRLSGNYEIVRRS